MLGKFMDYVVNIAIHDSWDIRAGIVNAVVSNTVLGEIIGADFFGAITGAN